MSLSIAFLSRDLPSKHPNGVSCQVDLLAQELCRMGHSVTIFSLDPKGEEAAYSVVQDSKGQLPKWKKLFRPALYFAEQNFSGFDVIHAHGDNYLLTANRPMIRTFYGSALWEAFYDKRLLYRIRQLLFYPLEWLAGKRSSCSIGISKITAKALPFINQIIPCGVDTDFFKPGESKTPHPTLLFVGNLSGRKQGWKMIRIFLREILPQHPSAKLILVTKEKVSPHPSIETYPNISPLELCRLYQTAWVVCMTSQYEGFGVPIVEAYACKTAVVSLLHQGAKEIIHHQADGILCKEQEMGKWICEIIQNNPFRQQLETEGLKRIKEFSIRAIAESYEDVYENLLSTFIVPKS